MNAALNFCDELAGRALTVCQQAERVGWEAGQNEGWLGGFTFGIVIGLAVVVVVAFYRLRSKGVSTQ